MAELSATDVLRQWRNQEARLRRQARRLGLVLHKAREVSCRGGRQCAMYGGWTLWDLADYERGIWTAVPWPSPASYLTLPGLYLTLDEVEAGLDDIERQRAEAAG